MRLFLTLSLLAGAMLAVPTEVGVGNCQWRKSEDVLESVKDAEDNPMLMLSIENIPYHVDDQKKKGMYQIHEFLTPDLKFGSDPANFSDLSSYMQPSLMMPDKLMQGDPTTIVLIKQEDQNDRLMIHCNLQVFTDQLKEGRNDDESKNVQNWVSRLLLI